MSLAKHFLGVGINHFAAFPDNSLAGCLNDIEDARIFFAGRGFDYQTLLDTSATEGTVKAALLALKGERWQENSMFVIWCSAHGSQIHDPSDPSGVDEVFCCADFDGEKGCVADKWWGKYLADIPASTRVYLMADSCHSGDLTRELGIELRHLPNPLCQRNARKRNLITAFLDHYIDADASYPGVLYSGCDENGSSADAHFAGRANGAFSYFALAALKTLDDPTNKQLSDQINRGLRDHCYRQHSHLQCSPALVDEVFTLSAV